MGQGPACVQGLHRSRPGMCIAVRAINATPAAEEDALLAYTVRAYPAYLHHLR